MDKLVNHTLIDSVDGIEVTKVTSYGQLSKKAEVVLLAQHAGQSRQLMQRINGSQVEDPRVYEEFLRIDRDAGTVELAHAIARELMHISGDFKVQVLEVLYERGILDPNRIAGHSIRKFLNVDSDPKLRELMIQMHARTSVISNTNLAEILETGGFFVDLHSMAPYDPLDLGAEELGTLKSYNDAYSSRKKRGARRSLDLITDIPGEKTIAHPLLLNNMLTRLEAFGIPLKLNDPYPKPGMPVRNIMSARYMEAYPGVALDFPKDQLSKGEADNHSWEIADLEPDPDKIDRMARIIASAVVETSWEIHR